MFYKISRLSRWHNLARKAAYSVLWNLPDSVKFGAGEAYRKVRYPYKLVKPGDTVIQIGAPWDVLKAGRSRSIYFSRLAGPDGQVIVFEPDSNNIKALESFIKKHKINNIKLIGKGAWHSSGTLRFLINDEHPASNLIEDVYDTARKDLGKYRAEEIEVTTLDEIVSELQIKGPIKLLSITSNGSENQILKGCQKMAEMVEYISIIGPPERYPHINDIGFSYYTGDDRGRLYHRPS